MANQYHNHDTPKSNPESPKKGPRGSFMEKPGFPSASLPGKTQPKDRSGGTTKAKVYPRSQGL